MENEGYNVVEQVEQNEPLIIYGYRSKEECEIFVMGYEAALSFVRGWSAFAPTDKDINVWIEKDEG